jgi:hypothetical protein
VSEELDIDLSSELDRLADPAEVEQLLEETITGPPPNTDWPPGSGKAPPS